MPEDDGMPREDDVRTVKEASGRYAMVSKHRIKNNTDEVVGDLWDHDLDREAGDNDPNRRFKKKK